MGLLSDINDYVFGNDDNTSSLYRDLFYDDKNKMDPAKVAGVLGGLGGFFGVGQADQQPIGYQGGIPDYTAVRAHVHMILTVGQEVWDVGIFLILRFKALVQ